MEFTLEGEQEMTFHYSGFKEQLEEDNFAIDLHKYTHDMLDQSY